MYVSQGRTAAESKILRSLGRNSLYNITARFAVLLVFRHVNVICTQVVPYGSGAVVEPEDTVRPRDAVVSCAHLWAILLIIAGVVEIVVGSLVFNGRCIHKLFTL